MYVCMYVCMYVNLFIPYTYTYTHMYIYIYNVYSDCKIILTVCKPTRLGLVKLEHVDLSLHILTAGQTWMSHIVCVCNVHVMHNVTSTHIMYTYK